MERVQEGLARVPSGDVEEMGLPAGLAANLTVDLRGCEGRKCPEFHSCFFERARAAAQQADLVITNHAVLCFSALQQDNIALPVRPLLIIDEAHELPGYAINALSESLEYETLPSLVNHPMAKEVADNELRRQAAEFNQAFFAALSSSAARPVCDALGRARGDPGRAAAV